jgi:hypothetical protein
MFMPKCLKIGTVRFDWSRVGTGVAAGIERTDGLDAGWEGGHAIGSSADHKSAQVVSATELLAPVTSRGVV